MKKIIFPILAMAILAASCIKDEVYSIASISDLSNTVAYTEDDAVTVTATVTAFVPIDEANLVYTASGSTKTVKMTGSGTTYTGTIPAFPMGTGVKYHVDATTSGGTVSSKEGSYVVGEVPIDYSGLVLNELNGNDKFIEIYNKGKDAIPTIRGISIQKDGKAVWTAPNIPLAAGGFVLLYSTDVAVDHPDLGEDYFFSSGLSAKKAVKVELFDPKDNSIDCFNLVNFVLKCDASYSRVPNGTGGWYHTASTPGAVNDTDTSLPVEGLE